MRCGIDSLNSVLGWLAGVFGRHAVPPEIPGSPDCEDSGERADLDWEKEHNR